MLDLGPAVRRVFSEESSTRDTMRVLLGSMGCQCVFAPRVQQAMTVLEQENPDAAILDPRTASSSTPSITSGFDKIYASLRGRILVIECCGNGITLGSTTSLAERARRFSRSATRRACFLCFSP